MSSKMHYGYKSSDGRHKATMEDAFRPDQRMVVRVSFKNLTLTLILES